MKKIVFVFVLLSIGLLFHSLAHAQVGGWSDFGDNPENILDNVAWEVNEDTWIQETQLNRVSRQEWWFASRYTISNTLDSIRVRIAPYLQWAVYIGLSLAVILIVYNWFLMVTGSLHSSWEWSDVQKRLTMIVIGVLLLTGFYFVVKIIVVIANSLTA